MDADALLLPSGSNSNSTSESGSPREGAEQLRGEGLSTPTNATWASAAAGRISSRLSCPYLLSSTSQPPKPHIEEIFYPPASTFKIQGIQPLLPYADSKSHSLRELRNGTLAPEEDHQLQCRYCHAMGADRGGNSKGKRLIAPCRCSGSVRFVHTACLTRWIEVSSQKMYPTPRCELCGYKYRRRPFIDLTRLHLPYIECCDRILNLLFLLLLLIMFLCGWVAVHYLKLVERRPLMRSSRSNSKRFLTENDVTVIIASILFFAAFFIALFTQYRAEVTIFRMMARLWTTNRNWRIRNYELGEDTSRIAAEEQAQLKSVPKSSSLA